LKPLRNRMKAQPRFGSAVSKSDKSDFEASLVPSEPAALTAREVQSLLAKQPRLSIKRLLVWQLVVGLVVVAVVATLGSVAAAVSAAYGVLACWLPNAVMAWGLRDRPGLNIPAGAVAANWMIWEFVKLVLALTLLALAVKLIPATGFAVNWLVLVVAMVVTMKVFWFAALIALKPAPNGH
jgi:ATP synthase protein I